jgi:hypothetical protein
MKRFEYLVKFFVAVNEGTCDTEPQSNHVFAYVCACMCVFAYVCVRVCVRIL